MTGAMRFRPDSGDAIQCLDPHVRPTRLATHVKRQAQWIEPQRIGAIKQFKCARWCATELARQRPIGLGRANKKSDVNLRARRMCRYFFKLFFCIRRKKGDTRLMRKRNIAGTFDRVAEGNA